MEKEQGFNPKMLCTYFKCIRWCRNLIHQRLYGQSPLKVYSLYLIYKVINITNHWKSFRKHLKEPRQNLTGKYTKIVLRFNILLLIFCKPSGYCIRTHFCGHQKLVIVFKISLDEHPTALFIVLITRQSEVAFATYFYERSCSQSNSFTGWLTTTKAAIDHICFVTLNSHPLESLAKRYLIDRLQNLLFRTVKWTLIHCVQLHLKTGDLG